MVIELIAVEAGDLRNDGCTRSIQSRKRLSHAGVNVIPVIIYVFAHGRVDNVFLRAREKVRCLCEQLIGFSADRSFMVIMSIALISVVTFLGSGVRTIFR